MQNYSECENCNSRCSSASPMHLSLLASCCAFFLRRHARDASLFFSLRLLHRELNGISLTCKCRSSLRKTGKHHIYFIFQCLANSSTVYIFYNDTIWNLEKCHCKQKEAYFATVSDHFYQKVNWDSNQKRVTLSNNKLLTVCHCNQCYCNRYRLCIWRAAGPTNLGDWSKTQQMRLVGSGTGPKWKATCTTSPPPHRLSAWICWQWHQVKLMESCTAYRVSRLLGYLCTCGGFCFHNSAPSNCGFFQVPQY